MPEQPTLQVDDFIAEYGDHVDAQSAAVFVGAGLSMLSGYPSWTGLVSPYRSDLGVGAFDDLPLLVQYYQDSRRDGAERVREDIIGMVRHPDIEPNEAHRRILSLPIPDIWTSNYDRLLERAGELLDIGINVYSEDHQLTKSQTALKRLYKMHGSVEATIASEHLVISRDDFERYPNTHPRFWQLLRAHFLTRSFLFVGFSLSDPNITEIFRLARLYAPGVQRPHYAVLARPIESERRLAELRRPDLARVGVRVVEIEDPQQVDTVLARLNARCRPPRAYISGSVASDDPDADRVKTYAEELGRQLSSHQDVMLMAGGELGALVGYTMCQQRVATGTYRPDDFMVIRRVRDGPLGPPNRRWGSMVFDGEEAEPLRSAAFERVRAVVVLGGAERTRAEIKQAKALGMGVISVAATGGAAKQQWESDVANPGNYYLGERGVDLETLRLLDHGDPSTAAGAAVKLIKQGLFLA